MSLTYADGRPITADDVRRARAQASTPVNELNRPHQAASRHGTFMSQWRPSLRSADADWLNDRDMSVARARDTSRNDPIGGAALHRRINSTVGFHWRLSSKPNARALGISFEAALELGRQIESKWKYYASGVHFQADATRKLTFGQLLRMSAAHIFQDGEAVGLVEWAGDEPTLYKTRLRVVDPDRLSNPNGKPDSDRLRGGVETNAHDVPIGYWIREGHPSDLGGRANMVWHRWDRFATPAGRPQVLHAFDQLRAGQTRGVTRLVQALKAFRAFGKYTDHTLEAAALNALFLGFVKSNAGPSAVKEGFESDDVAAFAAEREDFYAENPVMVDGVQMQVLGLDDEVQMQTTARDTSGFEGFSRSILRLISASLGVTYEELSMDFSQTNYSSARAAMLIAWNETLGFRELLRIQIAQPFFVAWLEEAFDIGELVPPPGAPDFHEAPDAYADGRWIGPARGYIDPTKEIDAAAARIEANISTLEDECADQGGDWEERLEQTAREMRKKEELGLPLTTATHGPAGGAPLAQTAEQDRQRDARP
ncbi:MAG: phage portal protein [Caulobacter sp.]|nr:phage portal protein [Caulobacter sp.]